MQNNITKCPAKKCSKKYDCFRYTAVSVGRVATFSSTPQIKEGGECKNFVDNTFQIERLAYFLWLDAGKPEGMANAHYMKAKSNIIAEKLKTNQ